MGSLFIVISRVRIVRYEINRPWYDDNVRAGGHRIDRFCVAGGMSCGEGRRITYLGLCRTAEYRFSNLIITSVRRGGIPAIFSCWDRFDRIPVASKENENENETENA